MELGYSKRFKKQYKKLTNKIQDKFNERLLLFIKDPNDPKLSIHKLGGKLEGHWSINVTGDIRAIFDKSLKNIIFFEAIGSHSDLYS